MLNRKQRRAERSGASPAQVDFAVRSLSAPAPGSGAGPHNQAGLRLAAAGRWAEAAAAFRMAIASHPGYAQAHNNLGIVLAQAGQPAGAIGAFREAVSLDPALAEAYANLGGVFIRQGEADAAVACCRQAVRLRPDHAGSHNQLGLALIDQGRLEDAAACFTEALRLKPGFADASSNLAVALQFQGRLREAEAACERALAMAPTGCAYHTLTQIRRFSGGDPQLGAMERLAAGGGAMQPHDRVALHFALGKAYDDCGWPERAFPHFLTGNALRRRAVVYDEAATLGVMSRLRRMFTGALTEGMRGRGVANAAPIFILGMPRSGSTLLEHILASHPCVHGGGERTAFGRLAGVCLLREDDPPPARLREIGRAYLGGLPDLPAHAARITDKMPGNFLYAGFIHLIFPNAKIIHTRRDAADTCFSCFTQLFRSGHSYSFDLAELGRYYRAHRDLMAHWRSVIPEAVMLDVEYEDLVHDPEHQVARILKHCGLDWHDACLDHRANPRGVQTASATQIREKIHARSVGRWQRYKAELGPLLSEL